MSFTEVPAAPIFPAADTLTLTDLVIGKIGDDDLTLTDTATLDVGTLAVTDTLTFTDWTTLAGITLPTPDPAATGGTGGRIVLKLHYGNDKRSPTRSLDLAQTLAEGDIHLLSGGFAPGAGERNELWTGESIRFDGEKKLAESRKNTRLKVSYVLNTGGSQAALSHYQRKISRFLLEAKEYNTKHRQGQKVWLEYRWSDNLSSLPTPKFGQLSYYYEVLSANVPQWPENLHDNEILEQGLIEGVALELTCSPYPEGMEQLHANAGGSVSMVDGGVLIASGGSSKLHFGIIGGSKIGQTNFGVTGNFTIEGWITLNTTWSSGVKPVFTYYADAANLIRIDYDRDNTYWTITKIVGGTTFTDNSAVDTVASGDHVHLALVQDDTALRLYVNGAATAAAVVATNTMTDTGIIALGCPAAGTLDGVDVILDGWRVFADDLTATQIDAIYDAELPIKTDGGQVGPPPYLWTNDGDGQLDNCDDTNRNNWGVLGGVGGDVEAKVAIYVHKNGGVYINNYYYYLGIKALDSTFTPSDYLWCESSLGTVYADAGSSGGSYRGATPADGKMYCLKTSLDSRILYGHYLRLTRIAVASAQTVTPAWSNSNTDNYFKSKDVAVSGSSLHIVNLGDIFIERRVQAADTGYALFLWQDFTGGIEVGHDFDFLLPYPFCKVTPPTPTSYSFGLYVGDGTAFISDSPLTGARADDAEYIGHPLTATPRKYNYLFLLQVEKADNDIGVTDTATLTVTSTPRYLLPGGMVA